MEFLNTEQRRVLKELAPYQLGSGWPNPEAHPGEEAVCDSLVMMGMLSKIGRMYKITEKGRRAVA